MSLFKWLFRDPVGRKEWVFPLGPAIVFLVAVLIFDWPQPLPTGIVGVLLLVALIGAVAGSVLVSYRYWKKDRRAAEAAGQSTDSD